MVYRKSILKSFKDLTKKDSIPFFYWREGYLTSSIGHIARAREALLSYCNIPFELRRTDKVVKKVFLILKRDRVWRTDRGSRHEEQGLEQRGVSLQFPEIDLFENANGFINFFLARLPLCVVFFSIINFPKIRH